MYYIYYIFIYYYEDISISQVFSLLRFTVWALLPISGDWRLVTCWWVIISIQASIYLHGPGECGRAAGHADDPPGDREPHQGGGGRAEAGGGAGRPRGPQHQGGIPRHRGDGARPGAETLRWFVTTRNSLLSRWLRLTGVRTTRRPWGRGWTRGCRWPTSPRSARWGWVQTPSPSPADVSIIRYLRPGEGSQVQLPPPALLWRHDGRDGVWDLVNRVRLMCAHWWLIWWQNLWNF